MLMAMTPNEAIYQNGFEDVDTSVNGCIDLYGAHDLTDANNEFHERDLKGEFRFFIAVSSFGFVIFCAFPGAVSAGMVVVCSAW